MFSRADESLRAGPSKRRGPEESSENGRQIEAAVESILDLGKIAMSVLGEIERMVGAGVGRFQVAQEGIDGSELLHLRTGGTAACHGALMYGAGVGDRRETPQPVRHHTRRGRQRCLGPSGDRFLGEFQFLQTDEQGMTVIRGLHRGDEGHLVLRAAAALASGQFPAQIGVVDLDTAIELARGFTLAHDMHQFVLQQPGRLVAHAQMALEFQGRDIVLGLGQQVHTQKPCGQRKFGGLKNRAARHRRLFPARRALPVVQPLALEGAMACATTFRTDEAVRPTQGHQRRVAFLFGTVALHELRHRQPLLKLHLVDPHRASPFVGMRSVSARQGSLDEPTELRG